jgi:hypothetical protein
MSIGPSVSAFPMSATSAYVPTSPEESAWERRWHLEWDRRNVED